MADIPSSGPQPGKRRVRVYKRPAQIAGVPIRRLVLPLIVSLISLLIWFLIYRWWFAS